MTISVSINPWGGDAPLLDIEVKGVMNFLNFKKLEFFRPTHKRAIWPSKFGSAKDSGIDVLVRPWSWWIILDDITEVSCTFHGASGADAIFSIFDGHVGTHTMIRLTNIEAENLYNAVHSAISSLHKYIKVGRKGILRPANKLIEYRVKSVILNVHDKSVPSPHPHASVFTPQK